MSAVHGCRIALFSYSFFFFSDKKTVSHRTGVPYIHERRIALFSSRNEAAYALFSFIALQGRDATPTVPDVKPLYSRTENMVARRQFTVRGEERPRSNFVLSWGRTDAKPMTL
jgi:hypothetical protein